MLMKLFASVYINILIEFARRHIFIEMFSNGFKKNITLFSLYITDDFLSKYPYQKCLRQKHQLSLKGSKILT